MPRRDDAQLTEKFGAGRGVEAVQPPPGASCTCEEFRRNHVCDHVLMAAAVRMVRRMIDIHSDEESKPH